MVRISITVLYLASKSLLLYCYYLDKNGAEIVRRDIQEIRREKWLCLVEVVLWERERESGTHNIARTEDVCVCVCACERERDTRGSWYV